MITKFAIISSLFLAVLSLTIFYRKNSEICTEQGSEVKALSTLIMATLSIFFQKKKNIGITKPAILISFLFFVASLLYFVSNSKLSPLIETICKQPRLITAFILNYTFLTNRIFKNEVLGLTCILISLIMIGYCDTSTALFSNSIYYLSIYSLHAILEAFAFFFFDFLVVKKLIDFYNYIFICETSSFIFSICFIIYLYFTNQIVLFKYALDFRFYISTFLYVVVCLLFFALSFNFNLAPRILISIGINTSSDLIAEFVLNEINYMQLGWYFLCVSGICLYHFKEIKKYFRQNK